jgi:uncharacterized protein (TIGR00730 family)
MCVFAGSSPGNDPALLESASALGRALVSRGFGLVYGGASIGVMPDFLAAHEIAHRALTELKITKSMHERKDTMASLSDGFIALPGGFGTMEEFFEVITWAQLGLHSKPCGLLNVNGYYDALLRFLDTTVECQLLRRENREMVLVAPNADALLDQCRPTRLRPSRSGSILLAPEGSSGQCVKR